MPARTSNGRFVRRHSPVRFPAATASAVPPTSAASSTSRPAQPELPVNRLLVTACSQTDVHDVPCSPPAPAAPAHSRSAPMRQATFPTYDGSSDYTFYRAQFLALAMKRPMNEWAEALVVALREPASHILSTLTSEQLSDFHELDGALQTRFGKPRPRNQAVQSLKAARQQSDQTLREFGVAIDGLCREAYRDDPLVGRAGVLDKLVLDNFLAGVADPATRRLLIMSRPADLTAALNVASELEEAPQVKRVRQVEVEAAPTTPQANADPSLAAVLGELTAAVRAVQAAPAPAPAPPRPKPSTSRPRPTREHSRPEMKWTVDGRPICWKCDEAGHVGRECDRPKKSSRDGRGDEDRDDRRTRHGQGNDRRSRR